MENVKRGFIAQILPNDNIVIIKDQTTYTEHILLLSDVSRSTQKKLKQGLEVEFISNELIVQEFQIIPSLYRRVS